MKDNNSLKKDIVNGKKVSEILKILPESFSSSHITVGELKDTLSGRAYGFLLFILALPNLIPIPTPGLSTLLGAPLILITFQLMLGLKTPWLPKFLAKRKIKRDDMKRIGDRIIPYLQKLENILKPRLKFLVKPPADRLIAVVCVFLSMMIMMPIPFGNAVPALGICFFSLAILQRDGLFVIFGIIISLISVTIISAFLGAVLESLAHLFGF